MDAESAARIVNLDRADLAAGHREELARLVAGGDPAGFLPARTPFLGTLALAAAAAVALLLIATAVRVSRNSFPLDEPAFSFTTFLTAVALFSVGFLGLKLGADLAAGRWSGWCNASFGLVRLEGRRVTVYPWSAVSDGGFVTLHRTTYYDSSTGKTGLSDPRAGQPIDSGSPVREYRSAGETNEWVARVRTSDGEGKISIWVSDRKAFAEFRKEYNTRRQAASGGPSAAELQAPRRAPLPAAIRIAVIALAALVLAPLLVHFGIGPAMDRALLARDLQAPEAYDTEGVRTERLLSDYRDRLSPEQTGLLQAHWRRVCQRDAVENRKWMMNADNGPAKAALIAALEKSEKRAPSRDAAAELALLRADAGDRSDQWRAWAAGLLEKTLRAAVNGTIPADFDLSYDDVFDLKEGLSAMLLRADSVSGFRILVKRKAPGRQDEQVYADLAEAELRRMLQLLVEIEAWKPRSAGTTPGARERTASLKVTAGSLPRQWVVRYAEMGPDSGVGRVRAWLEGFLESRAARPEKGP